MPGPVEADSNGVLVEQAAGLGRRRGRRCRRPSRQSPARGPTQPLRVGGPCPGQSPGGEVQVLAVHAEDLLCPGGGLVQRPPQGLLPLVDPASGEQLVGVHLRAGRGRGVLCRQALRTGRGRRADVAVLRAPVQSASPPVGGRSGCRPPVAPYTNSRASPISSCPTDPSGRASQTAGRAACASGATVDSVRSAQRLAEGVGHRTDGQRLPAVSCTTADAASSVPRRAGPLHSQVTNRPSAWQGRGVAAAAVRTRRLAQRANRAPRRRTHPHCTSASAAVTTARIAPTDQLHGGGMRWHRSTRR